MTWQEQEKTSHWNRSTKGQYFTLSQEENEGCFLAVQVIRGTEEALQYLCRPVCVGPCGHFTQNMSLTCKLHLVLFDIFGDPVNHRFTISEPTGILAAPPPKKKQNPQYWWDNVKPQVDTAPPNSRGSWDPS